MAIPESYDNVRYLAAKATVDDRALNQRVMDALRTALTARGAPSTPMTTVELGAGIGATFRRLTDAGLVGAGRYRLVDVDVASLAEAARRLSRAAEHSVEPVSANGAPMPSVDFVLRDAVDFLTRETAAGHHADLIVAQALLDLLDVPTALEAIAAHLAPGGLAWLTITFDGATVFEPPIDPEFDALVEALYHESMDARETPTGARSGGSHAGRTLLTALPNVGLEIVEAGASDWVVYPRQGAYPADEAYFLHHVVNMVWSALRDHPEAGGQRLVDWITQRHVQIEQGRLIYIAHQIDVLARKS